ncbi:hypothetical protein GCM10023149_41660 [Mucilaginibacter gynuensis]|uniref:Uncharacterized protein n=1 Tax=Mucilaginibacter gynuensis TaxID=1302236 RepID=A0ABP8H4R6_9SPHI
MFKKKAFFSKYWLKYTNRPGYTRYKWELANDKKIRYADAVIGSPRLTNIKLIKAFAAASGEINFSHSGNAGDVIYALPTIKKIQELTGAKVNLYLTLGQPLLVTGYKEHPLGNVMLNQKMADMLCPLLKAQPYINNCEVYTDQHIHIDLDYFRDGLVPMDKGNIARWCGYITGINAELWQQWLFVEPDTTFADTIIIARSERYRSRAADYTFLSNYKNIKFIGVKSEYDDIKQFIPHIQWIEMKDFLQMAQTIAGCKFFIGNQSFPFSVAEALKVPRILEVSFDVINVVPEGGNGYDFLFQDHFETLVEMLNNN